MKRIYALVPFDRVETVDGKQFDLGAPLADNARRLAFELRQHRIRTIEDVDAALAAARAWDAQAILASGALVEAARERVAEFALRHRWPSAFLRVTNVETGGLLSYGPSVAETHVLVDRGMEYVDRILRGAKPAELPVAQPSEYQLVINLKTANTLGLKIPPPLLLRADRVIE